MMRGIEDKEYVICPSMNSEAKYRSYPYRWYVLSVSCFLALSNAAIWISYSTVATHVQVFYCSDKYFKMNGTTVDSEVIDGTYSDEFQLADCDVSFWTNQIFQIVGTVFGIAGIFITDKYGIRVSIYCGTVTNLIGIILRTFSAWPIMSQPWRLGLLYTGQTIAAISQPFFLVLSPKIAEFWFADDQRALANALSFAANPAGVVLGTVAPELIVDKTSMRHDSDLLKLNTLFLGFATVVMFMAFGVRSAKPPTPPSASSASNISPPLCEGLLKLFKIPIFYVQMVTLGMAFALCWGFFMGVEPMMTALDYHFVGYASALAAIAGFISSIIVGYYVDKTKKFKEVIKVGSVCIAIVAVGIDVFLRHKNSNWYDSYILGGLLVLLGFFCIPSFPIGLELGIETTYPIAEASSSGVLIISSQLLLFTVIAILNNVPKMEWLYLARNQKGHENERGDVIFEQNYQLAVDAWTIMAILSAVFTCTCLWPRYKRLEYEHAAMSDVKDSESTKDIDSETHGTDRGTDTDIGAGTGRSEASIETDPKDPEETPSAEAKVTSAKEVGSVRAEILDLDKEGILDSVDLMGLASVDPVDLVDLASVKEDKEEALDSADLMDLVKEDKVEVLDLVDLTDLASVKEVKEDEEEVLDSVDLMDPDLSVEVKVASEIPLGGNKEALEALVALAEAREVSEGLLEVSEGPLEDSETPVDKEDSEAPQGGFGGSGSGQGGFGGGRSGSFGASGAPGGDSSGFGGDSTVISNETLLTMSMSTNKSSLVTGFCGDPFWFTDVFGPSNSTNPPSLTWCFQHSVLASLPTAFLILLTPVTIIEIKTSQYPGIKWNKLTSAKLLITIALIAIKFLLLIRSIWQGFINEEKVPIVEYTYPIEHILTLVIIIWLSSKCRKAGLTSDGVIFCTWLLFVLTGIPEFYTWLQKGTTPTLVATVDFYRYFLFLAWFPLTLLQLFLHCFAEKDPSNFDPKISPESTASFISRQFVCWFNDIVSVGSKKALETEDLFKLEADMVSGHLFRSWISFWQPEAEKYHEKIKEAKVKAALDSAYDEDLFVSDSTPLLKDEKGIVKVPSNKKSNYGSEKSSKKEDKAKDEFEGINPPSIVRILWKLFRWSFLGATFVKLCSDILQFANPLLLNSLITFTESPGASLFEGIGIAVLMFICGELRSLFMNNYFTIMYRTGVRLQSVLTTAVFHKTLRLSNSARRGKTVGEIINLMAIDVERFQMLTTQCQQYWSTPLQIVISLFLLYQYLGIAFVGGVVVMLLMIPVNMFVSVIYEIRRKEIGLIRQASILRSFVDVANITTPFIVAIVSFITFLMISPENKMTPQVAFVSLSLFSNLRHPLLMISELIGLTVQTMISNKRLKDFFVQEELNSESIQRDDSSDYKHSIDVQNASFCWESNSTKPTLKNIDVSIEKGALVAIVGGINASLNLHNPLLLNLLKSPMSFYDTTPLGRILNRTGKDMEVVDLRIPGSFRQLQRLASITRSPLYAHFGETIQGVSTIRAFGKSEKFFTDFCEKVDEHIVCKYHSLQSNRWLSVRLELIGNFIILSAATLAVLGKGWGTTTAGVLGMSVSYSLNVTFMLNFLIRQISEIETNVVAVERIKEYSAIGTEASWESNDSKKPPKDWPSKGVIKFEGYCTRYREELELALDDLSAEIKEKEKVGIAGRTGAGKRSKFMNSTVVTIAHRVNTILDYDRIMVLNRGKVAEFDTVEKLLKDSKSIFSQMAKNHE
ncbi:hypothetical protein FO519_005999 [Halicephalobus sp. NKZ332]|nr:hypothetical protein FO519_005999 [Halicephalobus sp. NKZ332]